MQQVASPAMATARNYSAMSTAASMNYRDLPQNQTAWAQMAHGNQMGVGAQQWQPQQRRTPSENEMQVQPPTVDQMLAKLMSKMTVKRTEQPMGGATPPAFFPQPVQMQPAPRMQHLYLEQKFNSEPPRAPVFGAYPQGPAYGGYGPPARHGHPLDGCMYNSDPPANYRQVDTRQFASDPPMTATFSRPLLQQGMSPTRYHLDALLQSRTAPSSPPAAFPCDARKLGPRASAFGSTGSSTDCGESALGAHQDACWNSGSSGQDAAVPKTTLMIRNVPLMYTQELLMQEWPSNGTYDFLYLPRTCTEQTNLSYAFINFTTEADAMAFKAKWQKQRLANFSSRKPLNISYADVQGLEANLAQIREKRARRAKGRQCSPLVILNGEEVAFEEALIILGLDADDELVATTPEVAVDTTSCVNLMPFRPPPGLCLSGASLA